MTKPSVPKDPTPDQVVVVTIVDSTLAARQMDDIEQHLAALGVPVAGVFTASGSQTTIQPPVVRDEVRLVLDHAREMYPPDIPAGITDSEESLIAWYAAQREALHRLLDQPLDTTTVDVTTANHLWLHACDVLEQAARIADIISAAM